MRILAVLLIAVVTNGCDSSSNSEARYEIGHSDGYASGYNTTCKIRATLIEGDWSNESYASGYREGYSEGENACKTKDQPH
jgi:hypothetical protein